MPQFGYAMLLIWPVVAAFLFTRMPRASAAVWTLLGGYLLLPARLQIDLPTLPALDKDGSPVLAAVALCMAGAGMRRARGGLPRPEAGERPGWLPESNLARVLLALIVLTPLATGLRNADPLIYGPTNISGMSLYDSLSAAMRQGVAALPFLLGRRLLAQPEGMRALLWAMALSALAYSIPMLVEIRLSPQIHRWVYGFYPHEFIQAIRLGGFRPQVFLRHGLKLALFIAMALVAAVALARLTSGRGQAGRAWTKPAALWIAFMLVLCKTVGALATGALMAMVAALADKRRALLAATLVAGLTALYPAVRGGGLVPTQTLVSGMESIWADRADSLALRFRNEDQLLDKGSQRPLFGWGSWGRWRIYDERTGRDLTTSDGLWVITFGIGGWAGYVGLFGLLTLPIFKLFRERQRLELSHESVALCLILSVNLLDLLVNSGVTPITWLISGAILGHVEALTSIPAKNDLQRSRRRHAGIAGTAKAAPHGVGGPAGTTFEEAAGPRMASNTSPGKSQGKTPSQNSSNGPVRPGLGGRAETISPPKDNTDKSHPRRDGH